MSFEAEFLTMMPSTMSVYSFTSWTDYGEPVYSTSATTYRYRGEYEPTKMGAGLSEEVVDQVTAYVASTSPLNTLDRFILEDGTEGNVKSIYINGA